MATYPILSTRSQSTIGEGTNGDPSYKTTDEPIASADTNQFHIIHPVCKETIILHYGKGCVSDFVKTYTLQTWFPFSKKIELYQSLIMFATSKI